MCCLPSSFSLSLSLSLSPYTEVKGVRDDRRDDFSITWLLFSKALLTTKTKTKTTTTLSLLYRRRSSRPLTLLFLSTTTTTKKTTPLKRCSSSSPFVPSRDRILRESLLPFVSRRRRRFFLLVLLRAKPLYSFRSRHRYVWSRRHRRRAAQRGRRRRRRNPPPSESRPKTQNAKKKTQKKIYSSCIRCIFLSYLDGARRLARHRSVRGGSVERDQTRSG